MKEKFYVTTPIYYVNDLPHIGHAYTTIAADIVARFNRLVGKSVFFLTGTDEHGQKVEKAARETGRSPIEHADEMVKNFKKLWSHLNISNDAFIRTTDSQHREIVQKILQSLYDKGEIEKRPYKGWYCTPDERFWTEKEIVDGNCPDCGRPVERIEEENYFFFMSRYQDRLIRCIEDNPRFILPESRRNEVLGFLRNTTLGDLCISRPKKRLSWGVTLPFDEKFVTYVWLDALINYYSAIFYLAPNYDGQVEKERGQRDDSEIIQSSTWWAADHHIVGKDILTTHAVYWSTIIMALGLELPRNIFAHGWWTVEGMKMSKSLGNVVDPFNIIERFGADALRYFLFREVTFGLDGDFSKQALVGRINSDLANDFGNLVSRTFSMLKNYFNSVIPEPESVEIELKNIAEGIFLRMDEHLRNLSYNKALDEVWELITFLNKYIDSNKPWVLVKNSEEKGRLKTVIYSVLEGLRFASIYLYSFMPVSSERLYKKLTGKDISKVNIIDSTIWGRLAPGFVTSEMPQLFPRINTSAPNYQKEKKEKISVSAGNTNIGIEDFKKVRLKAGKILSAEMVKGSNKLIKLKVDIGEERQVVAGIGKSYKPDELIGKTVVLVSNLKPVKLVGVESQGMILASSDNEGLSLLSFDREVNPGSDIN